MPGRRQRTSEVDEESSDTSERFRSESPFGQHSSGLKRRRLDGDHSRPQETLDSESPSPLGSNHTSPRESDGNGISDEPLGALQYQPGAIVRVRCRNFVTYTSATFRCGPSLNMIIGPNGTGKSTLVCAICLGLGFSPSHLGRAKELGEYVTRGKAEAEIEIELAGRGKSRNPIIRRTIKREGNKSTWFINGAQTTLKKVTELVNSFRIQIDNLCQFLPQDRVVEFAALTPVQLLDSTQRAVAPPHVPECHKRLIELGDQRKALITEEESSRKSLKLLQARQDTQRTVVDRINERGILVARVKTLQMARVGLEYNAANIQQKEAERRKREAEQEMKELNAELAPSLRRLQEKEQYRNLVQEVFSARKSILIRASASTDKVKKELDAFQTKIGDIETELEAETTANSKRKKTLLQSEQIITRLESQLQEGPPDFDITSYQQRSREKEQERTAVARQGRELKESLDRLAAQVNEKQQAINEVEAELQSLRTQAGKKMTKLKGVPNIGPFIYKAWEWIKRNQSVFQNQVYGPPMTECSVVDPKYAGALETLCQASDLCMLTVTTQTDYVKLQRILYTKEGTPLEDSPMDGITGLSGLLGLGLDKVSIRKVNKSLSEFQPPLPTEALASYGFDGWALNYLEGPEPVLAMLCDNNQLHRTPISLRPHNPQQFAKIKTSPIGSWIAGGEYNRVMRRREYGPNAETTNVTSVRAAKYWESGESGISTAETDLKRNLMELRSDREELLASGSSVRQEFNELKAQQESIMEEKRKIDEEKAGLQKAYSTYLGLSTKLSSEREKKNKLIEELESSEERKQAINAKMEQLALDRGQGAINYSLDVARLRQLHRSLLEAEIRLIEAESELSSNQERNTEVLNTIKTTKNEVEKLVIQHRALKEQARRKLGEVKKIRDQATDEEWAVIEEWLQQSDKDIADLDAAIEADTQRISLLDGGDPDAVRKFHERQKEIDRLQSLVDGFEADLENLNNEIKKVRDQWEPAIDQMVAQISDAFSHNFAQIGCAGQVGVHKDEQDFRQWSIRIEVKFRENEQLSLLDSHRQSGGERAVSTIFYLMALQSLTRAPFRVVDEINQGMDPRNERMVHERMVDIACRENTSQYFLITPKLLNNLKYHERMTVHTIYSGETMPGDSTKQLDLSVMADLALRVAGKVKVH